MKSRNSGRIVEAIAESRIHGRIVQNPKSWLSQRNLMIVLKCDKMRKSRNFKSLGKLGNEKTCWQEQIRLARPEILESFGGLGFAFPLGCRISWASHVNHRDRGERSRRGLVWPSEVGISDLGPRFEKMISASQLQLKLT